MTVVPIRTTLGNKCPRDVGDREGRDWPTWERCLKLSESMSALKSEGTATLSPGSSRGEPSDGSPNDWRTVAAVLRNDVQTSIDIDLATHTGTPIANRRDLIDSTIKFIIRDEAGAPVAVMKIASEVDPQSVAESTQIAEEIAASLKPETARHILRPWAEHQYDGRSVALYPYLDLLEQWRLAWFMQRRTIAPHVMQWVQQMSSQTVRDATDEDIDRRYIKPLRHIVENSSDVGEQYVRAAKTMLKRIETNKVSLRTVAMHGDPWKNNILLDTRNSCGFESHNGSPRFVFIDWDTGQVHGYPFFDLLRLSNTLRTRPKIMKPLIDDYCSVVDADPIDIAGYITAALGHSLLNLNNCPRHVITLSAQMFAEDLSRFELI